MEGNKEEVSDRAISTVIAMLLSGDTEVERHATCTVANLMENVDLHVRLLEERGLPPLVRRDGLFARAQQVKRPKHPLGTHQRSARRAESLSLSLSLYIYIYISPPISSGGAGTVSRPQHQGRGVPGHRQPGRQRGRPADAHQGGLPAAHGRSAPGGRRELPALRRPLRCQPGYHGGVADPRGPSGRHRAAHRPELQPQGAAGGAPLRHARHRQPYGHHRQPRGHAGGGRAAEPLLPCQLPRRHEPVRRAHATHIRHAHTPRLGTNQETRTDVDLRNVVLFFACVCTHLVRHLSWTCTRDRCSPLPRTRAGITLGARSRT